MSRVTFDDIPRLLAAIARDLGPHLEPAGRITAIRDLWGKVRFLVPERPPEGTPLALALSDLGTEAARLLADHAYRAEDSVLYEAETLVELEALDPGQRLDVGAPGLDFRLVDRQLTGQSWATVEERPETGQPPSRVAFYSLKGGVGRSTAAAMAAWDLARRGRSVLVVDFDLESPGVSSGLLPRARQPEFGIVDWLVEDAIGGGDRTLPTMSSRSPLADDLAGEIWVVPAHGADPGDYVAKLGRCYVDLPRPHGRWGERFSRLLGQLEDHRKPDVTLLDARSGLQDLASAAVTKLADLVLLFAVASEQTWSGYRLLMDHWRRFSVVEALRGRLQMVAALVPETDRNRYLTDFLEQSWDLFRDHVYDEVHAGEVGPFSFDLRDDPAPHRGLPIYWHQGVAALRQASDLDAHLVEAAANLFLGGLQELLADSQAGRR